MSSRLESQAFSRDVTLKRIKAGQKGIDLKQELKDQLIGHKQAIDNHGKDMPEVRNWTRDVPQ